MSRTRSETELLNQAFRDAERSTHGALQRGSEPGAAGDVLPEDDDAGVGPHGLGERLVNGLDVRALPCGLQAQ